MKLRKILLVSIALGLLLEAALLASEAPVNAASTNSLKLEWVIRAVLSNNPSLKAARARWEAMRERIPQARAWADPRAGVDAERSDSFRFAGFNNLEWMVSQELPLTGKNRLRSKAAASEAEATLAELRRRELDFAARARSAFYRYANGRVQLEINRRNEEVLRQLTELSRQKYELGRRTQADVFVAETELARNAELRRDIERTLSDEQSQINTLMNLPPQNPLAEPEPVAFLEPKLDLLKMQAAALEYRPDLIGVRRRIDAAQAHVTLARRVWVPDPELRIEARQFEQRGLQEYDTGLFISLPWFNRGKYQGAIREARKNQESAEQELAALQSETLGMVRDQLRKIETFHHHYTIFRDRVLPLARQAVEASRIAYTAEQASILELLGAQRSAYETESTMQHHLTDYLTALAELEPMVGTMTRRQTP